MKPQEIISRAALVLVVIFVGGCTVAMITPFVLLALIWDWLKRPTFPFARWDD